LNKKDQSRTPQKEMPAVAFHHTTHKKMPTGLFHHSTHKKKWPQAHFFFHHTLKEMAESSFLSRNTNWGS
jgi:hypothetical protein